MLSKTPEQRLATRQMKLLRVTPPAPTNVQIVASRLTWDQPADTRYITHYYVRVGSDASDPRYVVPVGSSGCSLANGDANFWVSSVNQAMGTESQKISVLGSVGGDIPEIADLSTVESHIQDLESLLWSQVGEVPQSISTPVTIQDTNANRGNYDVLIYAVGSLYYETDRGVYYVLTQWSGVHSGQPYWKYLCGVMRAAYTSRPGTLGADDTGFMFWRVSVDPTSKEFFYIWDGSSWNAFPVAPTALTIGTVGVGASTAAPSVTLTGTAMAPVFNILWPGPPIVVSGGGCTVAFVAGAWQITVP